VNGGKPVGGYSTTTGRGTIHGYWECNACGAAFTVPMNEAQQYTCPLCGGAG